MAVTLSGLLCISPFDCIGEPATLAQRWDKWKAEFELYVAASGAEDKLQKRALLLHLAGPGFREIFKTHPEELKRDAKEFDKAMTCLSNHFEVKKKVPLARQKLLASKPNPGETINNFVTRLKRLAEHCNYGEEEDNQVRDIVIFHSRNKELKSKFYREENLSLSKLLEIVSTYHNKDAMILVSEDTANRTWEDRGKSDKGTNRKQTWQGKCWRCAKPGHMAKDCEVSRKHTCGKCGNRGHMEVCCRTKQDKQGKGRGDSRRRGNLGRIRDGVQPEQSNEEGSNASEDNGYYVFIASDGESNTLSLMIENELVDVIIDSGATCNLMSEQVFDKVSQGKLELLKSDRKVYAYASQEPLKLSGKCLLNICVPDTQTSFKTEFFVMPRPADTLLGRSSSEELGVLKVGVSVNACESRNSTDKKVALKTKYPKVFTGLEKLKNFQLKLHVDESLTPIAQAMRRIPFSRKQKVIDKLEELEALDVIEKVNGPTSWINPLVAVKKSTGDVRICLDMRQANRAMLREKHPVPTIEETLQEMAGAKVFSKLDLNMAFHQIELAP